MLKVSYHTIPSIQPIIHLARAVRAAAFVELNPLLYVFQPWTSAGNVTVNSNSDYTRSDQRGRLI